MKGYIQVYTGNGKGKTTAALGLALRAAGAGLNVYIGQFAKGMDYSEIRSLECLSERITLRRFGRDRFIAGQPEEADIRAATEGLKEAREAVMSGRYDLVILDEANIATYFNLISVDDLLDLMDNKPEHVELVITGRYADERVIEHADLVTEMREIKHYYNTQKVQARTGIEK